jgi:hypothetical protein
MNKTSVVVPSCSHCGVAQVHGLINICQCENVSMMPLVLMIVEISGTWIPYGLFVFLKVSGCLVVPSNCQVDPPRSPSSLSHSGPPLSPFGRPPSLSLSAWLGPCGKTMEEVIYAMLHSSVSALNQAFGGSGRCLMNMKNTTHGGPSARRASARRALGPPCVVFRMQHAPLGSPRRPRKARCKAEALLSNIA